MVKHFNDFKNRNFSVLWRSWTQTMEMKQNQTFFHETHLDLTSYTFYQKILKYFNDFKDPNFSVLWLKWTPAMEIKQNQTFFHGTYSNLMSYTFLSKNIKSISIIFGIKISQFCNWSEPKQWKWNQNQIFFHGHIQIWYHFWSVPRYKNISMTFITGIFQFHFKSERK